MTRKAVGLHPTSARSQMRTAVLQLTKRAVPACVPPTVFQEDRPMAKNKPPFRADVVGSILRTAPLKEARAKREKGAISAAQLKEVEDREIEKIIKKQEEVGLKVATDGEFRRSWWHFDFYGMLDGVEIVEIDHGIQFQGVQTRHLTPRIVGRLGSAHHPMIEHFKFLKDHCPVTPKMGTPTPA